MAYTLTVQDNAVYIINTIGYQSTVQGFGRVTARDPSAGALAQGVKTWVEISDDSGFVVKIATDDFDTIGGAPPAGTTAGIVLQINELFASAYPGGSGGTGTGSFSSGTATAGTTYTDATTIGSTVVAVLVNNSVNNANFTFNSGTGTVTLTGGYTFADDDIVTLLYTTP